MKIKNKAKHILWAALSALMLLGGMPTFTYAAQVNEYIDPADVWVFANGTTNEIPFDRLKREGLNPLSREYIIDKINLRRVQKDCLISFAGNQYSVPAEYSDGQHALRSP